MANRGSYGHRVTILLNHLGDGKHNVGSTVFISTSKPSGRWQTRCREPNRILLLNHLGDGKQAGLNAPSMQHLLNHLGDGKRLY